MSSSWGIGSVKGAGELGHGAASPFGLVGVGLCCGELGPVFRSGDNGKMVWFSIFAMCFEVRDEAMRDVVQCTRFGTKRH